MIELGDRLPTIHTPRLSLRWIEPRDIADLYRIFSDRTVARYWSRPAFTSMDQAEKLLSEIERRFRERMLFQWGITLTGEDRVIGTATLFHFELEHRRAEIGYALAHSHWGRGLAAEAVAGLIDFAVDTLGVHRLEADIDPRNQRSIQLVERLGFRREGLLPERYRVAGEVQDTVLYGLLAPWWKERSTTGKSAAGPVRAATREDRPALLKLLSVQLQEHGVPVPDDVLDRAITGVLDRPDRGEFLVVDEGAGAIGVAYLGFTWTLEHGGPVAWLEELYVVPAHRGRGLGSALLAAALETATRSGARAIDLEIEAGHERAANLYLRSGFRRLSRTRWQRSLLES